MENTNRSKSFGKFVIIVAVTDCWHRINKILRDGKYSFIVCYIIFACKDCFKQVKHIVLDTIQSLCTFILSDYPLI